MFKKRVKFMDKDTVVKALKSPYKPMLDYAMTYVSLSDKERICIEECIIKDYTEEETAEKIEKSRDYVAKYKASGLAKIQKAWQYCPLIKVLIDY